MWGAIPKVATFRDYYKRQTHPCRYEGNATFQIGNELGADIRPEKQLGSAFPVALFGVHVLELAGLEDLAALQALYELAVLVPSDDLHPRVRAGTVRVLLLGGAGAWRW